MKGCELFESAELKGWRILLECGTEVWEVLYVGMGLKRKRGKYYEIVELKDRNV